MPRVTVTVTGMTSAVGRISARFARRVRRGENFLSLSACNGTQCQLTAKPRETHLRRKGVVWHFLWTHKEDLGQFGVLLHSNLGILSVLEKLYPSFEIGLTNEKKQFSFYHL
jgi:hypothetical protein